MEKMNSIREEKKSGRSKSGYYCSVLAIMPVVFSIILALTMPQGVNAAVFNVSAGDTSGLINAITTANGSAGPHTINLTASTYTLTAVNNTNDGYNGLPHVTSEIILNGRGSIVQRSSASGTPSFRIFQIGSGGKLTLNDFTLVNGNNVASTGIGGGIYNNGTLNLVNSTVSGNSSGDGGGIYNNGTLNLINSTVCGNSAITSGGGIYIVYGAVNLFNSTVSNNVAEGPGGGIVNVVGTVDLINSTVSDNISVDNGGGIGNGGTLNLINSTVSGNSADVGGGISNNGPVNSNNYSYVGTVNLFNSTVSNNISKVDVGGGIFNYNGGTVNLSNSIVANQVPNCSSNDSSVFTSLGYNLDSDGSCGLTATGDKSANPNANLGPLQYNGGPTQTIALLSGSAAIDSGDPNGCKDAEGNLLTTDQRGFLRPANGGISLRCDMGAYEFNATPPPSIANSVNFVPITSTYSTTNDTTGCPAGFVGTFSFDAQLKNTSAISLSDLKVKVATLTGGNLLKNADGGPGGAGALLTIPLVGSYADGMLFLTESVNVPFGICLKTMKSFQFFVDVLGIHTP